MDPFGGQAKRTRGYLAGIYETLPEAMRNEIALAMKMAGIEEAVKSYDIERVISIWMYHPAFLTDYYLPTWVGRLFRETMWKEVINENNAKL